MDKVKVNNQIVVMRKFVKQAKVHAINKYVKHIKALQMKKGSEDQLVKNKRKVSRLLEKVEILKKMKPDSVSKSALSKAKDWKSLLEQKNIPLQDQCLAVLANYDSVQKEVEKFHASESHLVPKIPSLILEWEVKGRNLNKSEGKKASASFPNNIKVVQKAHSKKTSSLLKGSKESGEEISANSAEERISANRNSAEERISANRNSAKERISANRNSAEERISANRNSAEELLESNVSADNQIKSTLDDFFLTSRDDLEGEDNKHFKHERKETERHFNHRSSRGYIDNFKKNFSSNGREFGKSRKHDKSNSQFSERKTFPKNEGFQKKVQHQRENKNYSERIKSSPKYQNKHMKNQTKKNFQQKEPTFSNEKSEEVLHPSWEAKRKLKESVKAGFKGKRIVFEE